MVGMLVPVTPHRAVGGPCPLSLPWSRPLQAVLPPEPLHPLMVQRPDLPSEHPVGHPTAPAQVVSGEHAETLPQLGPPFRSTTLPGWRWVLWTFSAIFNAPAMV